MLSNFSSKAIVHSKSIFLRIFLPGARVVYHAAAVYVCTYMCNFSNVSNTVPAIPFYVVNQLVWKFLPIANAGQHAAATYVCTYT